MKGGSPAGGVCAGRANFNRNRVAWIECIDGSHDKVDQMSFRDPVPQIGRK